MKGPFVRQNKQDCRRVEAEITALALSMDTYLFGGPMMLDYIWNALFHELKILLKHLWQ